MRHHLFTALALVTLLFASLGLGSGATAQILPGTGGSAEPETSEPAAGEPSGRLQTLLEILKDDTARAELISELEQGLAGTSAAAEIPADTVAEAVADTESDISLGRRIALVTQDVAETAVAELSTIWAAMGTSGAVFNGLGGNELSILVDALWDLGLVIVLTIATFLILRRAAIPVYRRMGHRAEAAGPVRTVLIFLGSVAMDAVVVMLAWAIGYAVTVLVVGEFGQIGIRQTMYLNAFLLVEMFKVAMRAMLSPSAAGLRVLPLSNRAARRLARNFNVIVSVIGYGQLLVVPIINQGVSFAAGNAVSALLALIVLLHLVVLVIRHRAAVADWIMAQLSLTDPAATAEEDARRETEAEVATETGFAPAFTGPDAVETQSRRRGGVLRPLAANWHWFMLAYLACMFAVVMTQPPNVTFAALIASGKIILALILASLLSGLLSGMVGRGVRLPQDLSLKLPLLEPRLNRVVPRVLMAVRFVIMLIVVLFALDVIGLIALRDWMESQLGYRVTSSLISLAGILLVAYGVWLAMTSWVDYRLNPDYGNIATARETTLLTLLRNAGTIAIFILALMFCLSEIGLDIGPLLASAGVLGLAIGFGAQKMVQDIITGIFIQFENAINVGDVITVGGTTGTVEKLTIRSVSLRDVQGCFHLIPFSSVDMVSNYTRDFSYFVCDMGVAYRENVDEVKAAMVDSFEELREDADQGAAITGDLEWFGLQSFGDSAVVLRARIKTIPGKQWATGRAYNGILKRVFDERGIEIPFPHQTIFFGEAKDGSTQPIRIEGTATPESS
ncbi:MAG: mechanosensitive ion channel protein MscS [Pseudooceanicola sp.]|jgi:small-conductance mechanosensitive channel|nr:mechanosensitive ion channel protein MscS [Pseudooceanicola sp.]